MVSNPYRRTVPYKVSKIPIIGKWIGRVGRVVDITSFACQPTPEIWVKAAFYAIPTMMWTYFKPSPTDFAAQRFGQSHHTKKKPKFEVYATDIPEKIPVKGALGWAAFAGVSFARRVGWYFTIADAFTGGAVNWTSLAYQWTGCDTPGSAYAEAHAAQGPYVLGGAGTYLFTGWIVTAHQIFSNDQSSIVTPNGYDPGIGCILTSKPNEVIPGFDASWTMEMRDDVTGDVIAKATPEKGNDGHYYASMMYYGANNTITAHDFKVYITKTDGVIDISGGKFNASGRPRYDAIKADP